MRLRYANVVATLALFAAVGGGAYAAGLARNSVGSAQIKPDAVTGRDAKESSFAEVPKAASARTATTAANVVSFDTGLVSSEDGVGLFFPPHIGDLAFMLACDPGDVEVEARDAAPESSGQRFDWEAIRSTNGGQSTALNGSSGLTGVFQGAPALPRLFPAEGQVILVSGTFTYENAGHVISGIYSLSGSTNPTDTKCRFTGTGFVGSS